MIYLRYLVLVCVYCCATHIVLGILVWLSSSCIPNVASFSGLFILGGSFGVL
jgi:hypothetical protein